MTKIVKNSYFIFTSVGYPSPLTDGFHDLGFLSLPSFRALMNVAVSEIITKSLPLLHICSNSTKPSNCTCILLPTLNDLSEASEHLIHALHCILKQPAVTITK